MASSILPLRPCASHVSCSRRAPLGGRSASKRSEPRPAKASVDRAGLHERAKALPSAPGSRCPGRSNPSAPLRRFVRREGCDRDPLVGAQELGEIDLQGWVEESIS